MPSCKYFAFAAITALLGSTEASIFRGSTDEPKYDTVETMLDTINTVGGSFDGVFDLLKNIEMHPENMETIEKASATLEKVGPIVMELGDRMKKANADENHMLAYNSFLDKYTSLVENVRFKMEL